VTLGDTVGNNYSILSGLNAGDSVIVSGTQFLVDGMPVIVIPTAGPAQPAPAKGASGGAQSKKTGAQAKDSAAHTVADYHPHHRKHRTARARKSRHTQPARVS
jgi:hypothetical protein